MSDIIVTLSTFSEISVKPLKALKDSGISFWVNSTGKRMSAEEVLRQHPEARALVAGVEPYHDSVLQEFKHLCCISRCGVGVDAIDLVAAKRLNIEILNTPEEPIQAVAELTLAFILGLMRRLPELSQKTHAGEWKRITGNLLFSKKVGLIGYGRIARKVRKMLAVFEVEVAAFDPFVSVEEMKLENVTKLEMNDLLEWSEIVSVHASKSGSELAIREAEICRMKKGSWIINMARGEMVNDTAIANAIKTGHLAGYAADVFPSEPYHGPLLGEKNVILTPHEATLTEETRTAMELRSVENAIQFLKNRG